MNAGGRTARHAARQTPGQGQRRAGPAAEAEGAVRLVPAPALPAPVGLDDEQQRVVDVVARPGCGRVRVLAGPGTGKTTTIVAAVAARVAAGTPPEQVLTLTFSRKAAQELRARLGARLRLPTSQPLAWTFHGFSFRLLAQQWQAQEQGRVPRLLSGPEQDAVVRELLPGRAGWPPELAAALPTRGFADELRALLARARSVGLTPEDLADVAGVRDDWRATAQFYGEYLDVLAVAGQIDYAELVAAAADLVADDPSIPARYALVVVDEYQDTDPQQEQLLRALAAGGADVVVVGDPDQSIYAFRGAAVDNILRFGERFPGGPAGADVVDLSLSVSRRCSPAVLAATRAVARRIPLGGGLTDAHRRLRSVDVAMASAVSGPAVDTVTGTVTDDSDDGAAGPVEVVTHPTASAELAFVADLLRREHLERGTAWSRMALLVRSGTTSIPALRRALVTAGVPVEVVADEIPLASDPSLAPLLLAARVAADEQSLTPAAAEALLLSPLGGADPARVRQLGRLLRQRARDQLVKAGRPAVPPGSDTLVADAVAGRVPVKGLPLRLASPVQKLHELLQSARALVADDASAYDVLWSLWSGTPWPHRLRTQALGGGAASRAAHRDLDAVVALFDAASRSEDRVQHRGIGGFLDELAAQQIPAESLAERGVRPDAVRLLTAHRAKGLEWDVVVLPGVQEEVWPDLRRRGSLLDVDRLGVDGLSAPVSARERLAEERRLFYVACTRARRRLVVSAVDATDEEGLRPSGFLAELETANEQDAAPWVESREVDPVHQPRLLSMTALVADLRAALLDPTAPPGVHDAAAAHLAALARAGVRGADPDDWWGMRSLTQAPGTRDPQTPVRLSGTSLDQLVTCPLQWFLQHEAAAETARSVAMGFGSVIHALADEVAHGRTDADVAVLDARLERVWDQLGFQARWQSPRERAEARAALDRLLQWIAADRGRTLVDTEVEFSVDLTVPLVVRDEVAGSTDAVDVPVRLRGFIDRLEVDADGQVWIVDFKTGKHPPSKNALPEHVQLGVYQYAVEHGALAELGLSVSGGAELVHLRRDAEKGAAGPLVQQQVRLEPDDDGRVFVDELLDDALTVITQERYPARPGDACRFCDFHLICPAEAGRDQVVP